MEWKGGKERERSLQSAQPVGLQVHHVTLLEEFCMVQIMSAKYTM